MDPHLSDIYASPGKQLQLVIQELFPMGLSDRSFITKIDNGLFTNGRLTDLIYSGAINYVVRRLICTGEYLRRKFDVEMGSNTLFVQKLRSFVYSELDIPKNRMERLISLIYLCVEERARTITQVRKQRLLSAAHSKGWRCFFCGTSLEFVRKGQPNSATVDHLWPRAMGGKSESPNLVVACMSCNQAKADYVDASDYHFEEMCLVTDKGDDQFEADFKRQYRMAILTSSNYRCATCEVPASYVGELTFSRLEEDDIWHFLNVGVYCGEHDPN
jgi:hypothetical protein